MISTYLFDWGDTLMVDFPGVPGKMCDWDHVEALEGAEHTLQHLSQTAKLYLATGAAESTEADIKQAFDRVGLSKYLEGYFCKANLGLSKGRPEFLPAIVEQLNQPISTIAMVGNSLEKDIAPALQIGMQAIWLTDNTDNIPQGVRAISALKELCV